MEEINEQENRMMDTLTNLRYNFIDLQIKNEILTDGFNDHILALEKIVLSHIGHNERGKTENEA